MKILVSIMCAIMVVLLAVPSIATAQSVTANFEDALGTSEDYVDAYPGMGGNGWDGPWAFDTGTCRHNVLDVRNTNPLTAGSGNYFRYYTNSTTTGGDQRSGTAVRSYTSSSLDLTAPHSIEFSVRIDEDLTAGSFSSSSDRYCFYDAVDHQSMSSSETSWLVAVLGDRTDVDGTTDVSRHWLVYDYVDPTYNNHFDDTGIIATQGVVYTLKIELDLVNGLYDFSISGDDGSSAVLTGLDMGDPNGDGTVPGYINFSNTVNNDNAIVDYREMSIDMISITQGSVAIPGDTNGDNIVNDVDATTVASNWGQTGMVGGAGVGDFNGDGAVDAADASIMAAHWGDHNEGEGTAVPEPGSLVLLSLGVLGLAVRLRRGC